MKSKFSINFLEKLESFPFPIQNKFKKQLKFLISDIRYPSLHAKKYEESTGTWQARVDKSVRFYFLIEQDTYVLLDIRYHD